MDNKTINSEDRAGLDGNYYVGDHVVDIYERVLMDDLEHLSLEEIIMIKWQYILIKNDHIRLNSIHEALVV